jgi:hypothetical protein
MRLAGWPASFDMDGQPHLQPLLAVRLHLDRNGRVFQWAWERVKTQARPASRPPTSKMMRHISADGQDVSCRKSFSVQGYAVEGKSEQP